MEQINAKDKSQKWMCKKLKCSNLSHVLLNVKPYQRNVSLCNVGIIRKRIASQP